MDTTTATKIAAPDWLVPGAEVVVYSFGGVTTSSNVKTTTIAKVNKTTFRVADPGEPAFRLSTCSVRQGGSWSSWIRQVVPADSETARAELAAERRRTQLMDARHAVDAWSQQLNRETRLAAIAALQAVED